MHLSGEGPGRIQAALGDPSVRRRLWGSDDMAGIDRWAVHAGGRSILDAVEQGLELGRDALAPSRAVLARFGNMSSSTLMFILRDRMGGAGQGVALACGRSEEHTSELQSLLRIPYAVLCSQ